MTTLQEFYVTHPKDEGTRYYFSDIKKANETAQRLANEFEQSVGRYDIHGGLSLFRPEPGSSTNRCASAFRK
jgi:broad specificity phosphatase PhoE